MTLLTAVESLSLIELPAVSFIFVIPFRTHYRVFFTIALLLPFSRTDLPDDFRAGTLRFWPDQSRLLEGDAPIEDQITELHKTGSLGNLSQVYLRPTETEARGLWIIETHAGTQDERLNWMASVIALEGRSPWRETLR